MSEEALQSESEAVEVEAETIENPETGSDLAPSTETTESESSENQAVNQDKINAVINKKHFEAKEAERRAVAAETQLKEIQDKQLLAEQQRVSNIPEMPDAYDDNYEVKMQAWQTAVQNKAAFDANQNLIAQQAQTAHNAAQYKQQQELTERNQKFYVEAKEQGVSTEEMNGLISTIMSYGGIGVENESAIMQDPDAALILKHLAANPQEIAGMQQMSGYTLANHINTNIRAKAQALKPKRSNAPAPSTEVHGDGIDPEGGRYPHLKGVKFS